MRKKFLAMYALVGALVASPIFTSCIDDTESESVTAARKEATEKQRITNQINAAKAELQMKLDKLELEGDITKAEADLLGYQLTLKQKQAELDAYGVKTLSELTDAYTSALGKAANSEFEIIKWNKSIEAVKANYLSAQEHVAKETARLEAEIAAKEAEIEAVKKLQADGLDKSSMVEQVEELYLASQKANKEYAELENKYGSNADETVTGKAMAYLTTLGNSLTPSVDYWINNAESNPVLVEAEVLKQQKTYAQGLVNEEEALALAKAALGTEADKVDATYEQTPGNKVPTAYANLAIANEHLKKLEKALADLPATATEAEIEAAENAIANFKKNESANVAILTVGEGASAVSYIVNGLAKAEMDVLVAKDGIVTAEVNLAIAKEDSDKFEAAIAAFAGEDYETYLAAVAELKAAYDAKVLAAAEHLALDNLYQSYNDGLYEYAVYDSNNIFVGYHTISTEEKLKALENEIASYKEDIADLEGYSNYYSYDGVEANTEEAVAAIVAYFEKKIAIEETKLATYNKQAEEAKAALDAYLGTEEA